MNGHEREKEKKSQGAAADWHKNKKTHPFNTGKKKMVKGERAPVHSEQPLGAPFCRDGDDQATRKKDG